MFTNGEGTEQDYSRAFKHFMVNPSLCFHLSFPISLVLIKALQSYLICYDLLPPRCSLLAWAACNQRYTILPIAMRKEGESPRMISWPSSTTRVAQKPGTPLPSSPWAPGYSLVEAEMALYRIR